MGIQSHVRVEYWQNNTKVPASNAMLYPEGSDEVSGAEIGASDVELPVHGQEAAWNLASLTASGGNDSLVHAGFRLGSLIEGIKDLKTELSDKTLTRSINLNIVYPHPLFNTLRLVFESQSTQPFFGSPNGVRDAGHTPWTSAHTRGIQFQSDTSRFHRNAAYVIKLEELHEKMAEYPDRFFSTPDILRPFVFQFAVRESGIGNAGPVSVLHILTLNIFKQRQAAPKAYTEIVYWMRGPGDGFGQVVARRRLMDFAPRIWPFTPGAGEFQFAEAPLVFENGNWMEEGKPYNLVSVTFSAVSRRKHDGQRPHMEVAADHTPFAGGTRLLPHVTPPMLCPAIDERGQPYVAEGLGRAMFILSPETASPGTIVFDATQEPGEWTTRQNIRVFAGARTSAPASLVHTNDRRSGPFGQTHKSGQA